MSPSLACNSNKNISLHSTSISAAVLTTSQVWRRRHLKPSTQWSLFCLFLLSLHSVSFSVSGGALPGTPGTCWAQKFKDSDCKEPLGAPSFTLPTISQTWQNPIQMSTNCSVQTLESSDAQQWTRTYSDGQRMYMLQYAREGCNQTEMIISAISEPLNVCLQTVDVTSTFPCQKRLNCGSPFPSPGWCSKTSGTFSMIVCDNSTGEVGQSPITWPPLQLSYDYSIQYVCADSWCESDCRPQQVMPLNDIERAQMQPPSYYQPNPETVCTDQRNMCYGSDGGIITVSRTYLSSFPQHKRAKPDQGWCTPNATVLRVAATRATCSGGSYVLCPDLSIVPQHVPLPVEVQNLGWSPAFVQETIGGQCEFIRSDGACESGSMVDAMAITFPGVCQPGAGVTRSYSSSDSPGSRMDTCTSDGLVTTFFTDDQCKVLDTVHEPLTYAVNNCKRPPAFSENPFAIFAGGYTIRTGCDFIMRSDGRLFSEDYGDSGQYAPSTGETPFWSSDTSGSQKTKVRNVLITVGILVFLLSLLALRQCWHKPCCQRIFGLCQCSWWPFRLREPPAAAQVRPSQREFILLDMLPSSRPRIVNGVLTHPNRT